MVTVSVIGLCPHPPSRVPLAQGLIAGDAWVRVGKV